MATKKNFILVPNHVYVPKHEIIVRNYETKKKKRLLDSLQVETDTQLPLLLTSDPQAKYLGMQPGDICKISRENYVTYRTVVRQ